MSERIESVDVSEVEVTPEMIEVGILALYEYDPRFSNEKDIVIKIFSAMTAVTL